MADRVEVAQQLTITISKRDLADLDYALQMAADRCMTELAAGKWTELRNRIVSEDHAPAPGPTEQNYQKALSAIASDPIIGKEVLDPAATWYRSIAQKALAEASSPAAQNADSGWVSVEERLPAPNSAVLFWTTDNCWESGYFRADDNEPIRWECERTLPQDERLDFFEGQVTHWMVPSPPSSTENKG